MCGLLVAVSPEARGLLVGPGKTQHRTTRRLWCGAVAAIGAASVLLLCGSLLRRSNLSERRRPDEPEASPPEASPPLRFGWGGAAANVTAALALCREFDDDWSFPSFVCDCGDYRTQCRGNMQRSPRYRDLCWVACGDENMKGYDAFPSEDPVEKCGGLTAPAWGVPCAWQAVLQLPDVCAGRFEPEAPAGLSRDEPNAFAELSIAQKTTLGYTETFAGPCNAHAFCYTCLDDRFRHGVHPYCAAVFSVYGGTPETASSALMTSFFDDLDDFWCRPDVLATLMSQFQKDFWFLGGDDLSDDDDDDQPPAELDSGAPSSSSSSF